MKIKNGPLLIALILFSSIFVAAGPCGKGGMTVVRAFDGSGYGIYVFRDGKDFAFQIPGKNISFPNGTSDPRRFWIDEILFESLLVKPSEFMKAAKDTTDLDILKKHQAYEFGYLEKSPSPLKKLIEIGPKEKVAGLGQPKLTFYLWEAADPKDAKGPRQYFLSTLSEGDVVVLSAIVTSEAKEEQAYQMFMNYVSSFQLILKKEDCPEKAPK